MTATIETPFLPCRLLLFSKTKMIKHDCERHFMSQMQKVLLITLVNIITTHGHNLAPEKCVRKTSWKTKSEIIGPMELVKITDENENKKMPTKQREKRCNST